MTSKVLPPHIGARDKVILFDGVCKLCNAWSNFILKYDKKRVFKLCSVQSKEGKEILDYFGFPTHDYETMIVVEGANQFSQSDAFFHVMSKLGYPWKLVCIFSLIPKGIRNWLYDRIALNRYRLFGKYDYCSVPSIEHQERFINDR